MIERQPYVGRAEIGLMLGVTNRSKLYRITTAPGFPEPTRLAMGHAWSTDDVERWIAEHWPASPE